MTIRSDIEHEFTVCSPSSGGSYLRTDVERLVVFVCALVDGAVLYAVFTVDVHRDVVGVEGVKVRTLVDTLRGSGFQRVVGVAVGITNERFVGFAIVKEFGRVTCTTVTSSSHEFHKVRVCGIVGSIL